jgi:carbonic anhydrase/acetyltransferase-like protein (isoleucine patch superfamily)
MPLYTIDGIAPDFEDEASNWIAPDATVIGRVRIGRDVGIWFGAAIRGDNEPIAIGARTNVQELVVMHTDPGFPLTVGEGCTIGHRALLHGCTVGENTLIGMGAIVLNGARIGNNCLVGAGALVTEGKAFEDNSLIMGVPARAMRTLDAGAVEKLKYSADHYVENARRFRSSLQKLP